MWFSALIVVVAVGAVVAAWLSISRPGSSTGQSVAAATSVHDLEPGDCIDPLPAPGQTETVSVVACRQYHSAQLVARLTLDGEYPGDDTITQVATARCGPASASALQKAQDQLTQGSAHVTFFAPSAQSWQRGDRTLDCLVYADGPLLLGTLVDAEPVSP